MKPRKAFTLVELLIVISIIALLVGILLPALSRARDAAMINASKNNIRNVYMANQNYNTEWKGAQWVGAPHNLAKYGDNLTTALSRYSDHYGLYTNNHTGVFTPGPGVQFGETSTGQVWFPGLVKVYIAPYCWASGPTSAMEAPRHGTFLYTNTRQIGEYMEDQVYNKAFFAPKDAIILDALKDCFSSTGNLCPGNVGYGGYTGDYATFNIDKLGGYEFPPFLQPSSYCYSPANMVNPDVYDSNYNEADFGFKDPCTFNTGFRAPTLDQSKYSSLKSYLMEHHWLQSVTGSSCHPRWEAAHYDTYKPSNPTGWHWGGCYPSLAVHSFRSVPVTCFNDGHVAMMDINSCDKADNILINGNVEEHSDDSFVMGTWHRRTHDQESGYWLEASTDWMDVSPHTHTTFGSNGRDVIADVLGIQ